MPGIKYNTTCFIYYCFFFYFDFYVIFLFFILILIFYLFITYRNPLYRFFLYVLPIRKGKLKKNNYFIKCKFKTCNSYLSFIVEMKFNEEMLETKVLRTPRTAEICQCFTINTSRHYCC